MTDLRLRGPAARTQDEADDAWRELGHLARATRARDWLHFVALPLAGESLRTLSPSAATRVAAAAAAAALLWAGVYLVNSVSDVDVDSEGDKNPLVGAAPATRRRAAQVVPALLALSCGCAWAVGPTAAAAAVVSAAMGVAYSVGPRLKKRPLIGTLANVMIFAPGLFLGVTDERSLLRAGWLALPFSVLLVQNQLVHEAIDATDDAGGSLLTTYRWGGPLVAAAVLVAVSVAGAAALWGRAPGVVGAALAVALLLPALPLAAAVARAHAGAARLRLAHRYYALAVGALCWVAGALSP